MRLGLDSQSFLSGFTHRVPATVIDIEERAFYGR
jgi:hypothetical protein